jgi:hypothetical protein
VTIDGVAVDVMIDGLSAQNRALDGDTVIISLFNPARWPNLTSSHLVIGGKPALPGKSGKVGITNETAVETRIIDVERGTSSASGIELLHQAAAVGQAEHVARVVADDSDQGESDDSEEEDDSGSEEEEKDQALFDKEEREVDIDDARFQDDEVLSDEDFID